MSAYIVVTGATVHTTPYGYDGRKCFTDRDAAEATAAAIAKERPGVRSGVYKLVSVVEATVAEPAVHQVD